MRIARIPFLGVEASPPPLATQIGVDEPTNEFQFARKQVGRLEDKQVYI